MNLSFLDNLTITTLESKAPTATKKEANPPAESLCVRIHKDGSIYPSAALVHRFNLEFPKAESVEVIELFNPDGSPKMVTKESKEGSTTEVRATQRKFKFAEGTVANGFDVFTLANWTQIPDQVRATVPNVILIAVTPKDAGRVELFSSVRYNDDGSPVSSVLDQGANTYGKTVLLPLLKEVYGVEVGDEGYVDLEIAVGNDLSDRVPNRVFVLPKTVTRGTDKGKMDYEMRNSTGIFPLVPFTPVAQSEPEPTLEVENTQA
jgi:hypothetical protein